MPDLDDLRELIDYLARTSRLTSAEAERLVNEVLTFLGETPEAFIRRRHHALQSEGLANDEIFARLAKELGHAASARRLTPSGRSAESFTVGRTSACAESSVISASARRARS